MNAQVLVPQLAQTPSGEEVRVDGPVQTHASTQLPVAVSTSWPQPQAQAYLPYDGAQLSHLVLQGQLLFV